MNDTALVIGGGIAGLTAALGLSSHGFRVTVIEQDLRLGGRLAVAPPSLLLGCHTATWSLLEQLDMAAALRRGKHAPIDFLQASGSRAQYPAFPLPSPLNTLVGTTLFQGLSMRDRWHLLTFLERTWERDPPMPQDLELRTASDWLASIDQSDAARTHVWNLLSRFLVGNDLHDVSAALFMRTLRRSFFTGARSSRFMIPEPQFSEHVLDAMHKRMRHLDVAIRLNTRASGIQVRLERMTGVRLDNGDTLTADWYLSAVPVSDFRRLLPEQVVTHYSYFQQLNKLHDTRLLIVMLRLAHPSSQSHLTLLSHRSFHWIVSQPDVESPHPSTLVWLVATGETALFLASDSEVFLAAKSDMAIAYPPLEHASMLDHRITRISNAFMWMKPGAQHYRPLPRSPLGNLFVAGDWTDTGWPANLESAVLSGQRCAEAIASQRGNCSALQATKT